MAEAKKASLTVLGGPLAGTRTLLPDDAEVTIGSSEECALCLEIETVSPTHARLVTEGGQITVFATGAERPLHVNDSAVGPEGSALRNGDILWLGTPGEDDVVMLQCILPRRPAAAPRPEPATSGPAQPTPDIETTALWAQSTEEPAAEQAPVFPAAEDAVEPAGVDSSAMYSGVEEPAGDDSPAMFSPDEEPATEGAGAAGSDEPLVLAFGEEERPSESGGADEEAVIVDEPPSAPEAQAEPVEPEGLFAPVDLGDAGAVVVDEDELFSEVAPTFIAAPNDFEAPLVDATATIEPEEPESPAPPLPPPAHPAPAEPAPSAPPPARAVRSSPAERAGTPPARPVARPGSGPDSSTPPPGASQRVPRTPREGSGRRMPPPGASMARRRPAPRREAAAVTETGDAPAPGGRSPALLAIGGIALVLVLAGAGWAVWRFVLSKPAPPSTTPVASATPFLPPAVEGRPVTPTPDPLEPEVPADAEPTDTEPSDTDEPTTPEPLVATPEPTAPVAAPAPAPTPTPTPRPTPTPTPRATPTPAATPTPTPPPADTGARQTAQRVQGLLSQAQSAAAARQYDAAVGHLDEALRLDPGNAQARSARASAVARRDLAKRRFVGGRTRVQTEKDDDAALTGFDTGDADLRRAPDFDGAIEFEVTPPSGIEPGEPWTLRVFVVNGGQKPLRVQGVTAATKVNGGGSGGPVAPQTSQIAPQQRALVAETSGTWAEGTTSWSTEVTVTANKGDTLRATVNWR